MSGYEFVPVLERASINDYVRLFAEVYGLTSKLQSAYLKWLYAENPSGQAVGVDAYKDGMLAAHYATVPRDYIFRGEVVRCLLSVNTATHPEHQRRGLFKATALETYSRAAQLGFKAVVGVANDQSIHAFQTSLGFKNLGQVGLTFNCGASCSSFEDALQLDQTDEWVAWRLSQPVSSYFLTGGRSGYLVNAYQKGVRTVLGSITTSQAERTGLPVIKFPMPIYVTPRFPLIPNRLKVPQQLIPSPWHVIIKTLTEDTFGRDGVPALVGFNGLAMDSF